MSTFNYTAIPFENRFGLCLPEECRQADFDKAGVLISKTINNLPTANVPGVPKMAPGGVFTFYYRTHEYTETWQNGLLVGTVCFAMIFLVFLTVLLVGSCHAHYKLKRKD